MRLFEKSPVLVMWNGNKSAVTTNGRNVFRKEMEVKQTDQMYVACKIVLSYIVHRRNNKIIKLKRFGS
jgi:hypothetical protein